MVCGPFFGQRLMWETQFTMDDPVLGQFVLRDIRNPSNDKPVSSFLQWFLAMSLLIMLLLSIPSMMDCKWDLWVRYVHPYKLALSHDIYHNYRNEDIGHIKCMHRWFPNIEVTYILKVPDIENFHTQDQHVHKNQYREWNSTISITTKQCSTFRNNVRFNQCEKTENIIHTSYMTFIRIS